MLVAWVLCLVLYRVEMLKIVFVCVSRFLCFSSYFSFSKLFRVIGSFIWLCELRGMV